MRISDWSSDVCSSDLVDADADQLRKYLEHLRLHVGGDVLWVTAGIVTGAAEQQTAIGAETEVIERHALIADRHVLRQQLAAERLRQALGCAAVAARRQHLSGALRL